MISKKLSTLSHIIVSFKSNKTKYNNVYSTLWFSLYSTLYSIPCRSTVDSEYTSTVYYTHLRAALHNLRLGGEVCHNLILGLTETAQWFLTVAIQIAKKKNMILLVWMTSSPRSNHCVLFCQIGLTEVDVLHICTRMSFQLPLYSKSWMSSAMPHTETFSHSHLPWLPTASLVSQH